MTHTTTPGSLQGEYRAGGRVHTYTPSRVAPPVGRHQLNTRKAAPLSQCTTRGGSLGAQVERELGMSKRTFKQALGQLYKKQLVTISNPERKGSYGGFVQLVKENVVPDRIDFTPDQLDGAFAFCVALAVRGVTYERVAEPINKTKS